MMNNEMMEALESKFWRHGYSYVGLELLGEVMNWLLIHYVFKDYKIQIDRPSKIQVRVTLVNWDNEC
jgi:hypothetical protein